MVKKEMTAQEAGRKGGETTSKRHGEEFYSEIGKKGAAVRKRNKQTGLTKHKSTIPHKGVMTVQEAGRIGGTKTVATHGREFYEEIGQKGGEKVSEERGPEFYSEIGHKGGSKRAMQHEGSPEAEGKISIEEAGRRGRSKRFKNLNK